MKPGKNKHIFKMIGIGVIVVLLSITFFCSKKEEKTEQYQVKPRRTRSLEPVITEVKLEPSQPTSTDSLEAIPVLKDTRMKHVKFRYQWFVNERIIREKDNQLLEKQHYKKGDIIYCRVKATRGIYESKVIKSKPIKIKNSGPIIKLVPWENVRPPGRFRYTINASDPDNDPLTYQLVSPLDVGIDINPETGEILWDIPEIPEPEPIDTRTSISEGEGATRWDNEESAGSKSVPENQKYRTLYPVVKIVFEVRDSDGEAVVSSIRLDLTSTSGRPQ
ncbi:MAG: cadherin repeat domain-containing protein [Candidatus Aminicenantes bacterium]|nr:MAG: cadherin repeat domain-containing protein [Candidatus Aminicenantes bacterium]